MKKLIIILLIIPAVLVSQPKRYYFNFDDKAVILSEKLVAKEMGLREKGNNKGEHIKKYARSVFNRSAEGFAYCLAGQYWAIQTACETYNVINYLLRTGHCNTLFNFAQQKAVRDYSNNYQVHDLLIWKQNNSSSGHVERIKSIKNRDLLIVETYAFNTQLKREGNVRDGGGNAIKVRHLKHPLGRMFLRGAIGL